MELTRRKLFSTTSLKETKLERKKLFSTASTSNSKTRIKLFGDNAVNDKASSRMFSEGSESKFGELLGEWQGKELNSDYSTKIFSGVDLVSEGLAEKIGDNKIKIFSIAQDIEKMFSSLKITVIKELNLDPMPCPDFCPTIENMGMEKSLPTKTIVLLKKAHGIPKESIFSDTENWINDSGLIQDLGDEFGDKEFTRKELENILEERYDDAPEEITDYLISSGIIENGSDGNLRLKK